MTTPQLEYLPPNSLVVDPRNARTHTKKQIRQIANSIEKFGFTNPVLIDENATILAGHGRVAAAKLLDLQTVPCRRLAHMSREEKRAYVIADNKLALNAGWDEEILAIELKELVAEDLEIVSVTGFSVPEIDNLIDGLSPTDPADPADEAMPAPADGPVVSRVGDLWQLGPHRLYCGDSRDPASFEILLGDERAEMVFTDPPYNVRIQGHVSGVGATKHREFVMGSGEMSQSEFVSFLITAFKNLAAYSVDGSIHYVCMDWRHMVEIQTAGSAAYDELKNLIVWVKDNGGMGTFYRSRHELIFAFKHGTKPHINNFELGQHGRNRTNVWNYRGVNTMRAGRMAELQLHPTVKPVAMVEDAIKDVSRRNGIVLDAFGGSGSTLIAAHKAVRRARLVELDPIYVDRIIRRWQAYAHDDAILIATGERFDEVSLDRAEIETQNRQAVASGVLPSVGANGGGDER